MINGSENLVRLFFNILKHRKAQHKINLIRGKSFVDNNFNKYFVNVTGQDVLRRLSHSLSISYQLHLLHRYRNIRRASSGDILQFTAFGPLVIHGRIYQVYDPNTGSSAEIGSEVWRRSRGTKIT